MKDWRTDYAYRKAAKEGWNIFSTGKGTNTGKGGCYNDLELQRIDEDGKFKNDMGAIKFVVDKALKRKNSIHAQAIKHLAKKSPNEIDNIFRSTLPKKKFNEMMTKLKIQL